MKREIEFRALFKGKIHEIFTYKISTDHSPEEYITVQIPLKRFPFVQTIIPDEIMQYTGLLDKNGKKIYEGDIIELAWSEKKWQVISNYAQFDIQCNTQQIPLNDPISDIESEIIGNIYENPELL